MNIAVGVRLRNNESVFTEHRCRRELCHGELVEVRTTDVHALCL